MIHYFITNEILLKICNFTSLKCLWEFDDNSISLGCDRNGGLNVLCLFEEHWQKLQVNSSYKCAFLSQSINERYKYVLSLY